MLLLGIWNQERKQENIFKCIEKQEKGWGERKRESNPSLRRPATVLALISKSTFG
jgi:hypothetical protein